MRKRVTTELRTVIDFCLEHAESAPVKRRISLYRGLAEICCDENLAAKFCSLAECLEASDKQFREFKFQFGEEQQA